MRGHSSEIEGQLSFKHTSEQIYLIIFEGDISLSKFTLIKISLGATCKLIVYRCKARKSCLDRIGLDWMFGEVVAS